MNKSTKIHFIYTNINGFHADTYSFGLAAIVSMTRSQGYPAKVSIVHNHEDYSRIIAEVKAFRPKIVGFSTVSSQYQFVKELAVEIKTVLPDALIVCGGVHPTIAPQCVLESSAIETVFMGESEDAFVEFLEKIESGKDWHGVSNLAYGLDGKLVKNKLKPQAEDLDRFPQPDREIYPFGDTIKATGFATFIFSRGCPFSCTYCSNHAIARCYGNKTNKPRYRSPEASIREIEDTRAKFPIDKILISDDLFGLDKDWRQEFCKQYRKRVKIRFMCLLRANVLDDEFAKMLKDAGCYRISIGVESGNDYIRNEVMNRQMPREMLVRAFRAAQKVGMETNAINIIGVPGETEEMLLDTIRLNRELWPTSSGVNIFYPYKGTVLGDYCFEKGLVDEDLYYNFSLERRDTVLKYTTEYKEKLRYYRNHWQDIIYAGDFFKKTTILLKTSPAWVQAGKIKRWIKAVLKSTHDLIGGKDEARYKP
jgi:radical SAM superfamily enzyme YgiQ (UPF0313 family)